jgi:flagellin-like hook-associated protein FlgL
MTGVSTLGQALDQIERIKNQQTLLGTLTTQIATGKKTQVFSGLGTDVISSKRARAEFKSLDTYINNIKNADRRINLMLKAVEEFKAQAQNFYSSLVSFSQQSVHQEGSIVYYDDPLTPDVDEALPVGMDSATPDADFRTLQQLASGIFEFMTSLLNTKDGERYLLGGAETLSKPIDNNGLLDSAVSSLLTGWKTGTITTSGLISDLQDRTATGGNTDALTDTIVGYNAQLSAGNVKNIFVRVDDNAEVPYTAFANEGAFRDIIVAMAYIKNENLPPVADVYLPGDPPYPAPPSQDGVPGATIDEQKDNFFEVFNSIIGMVESAINDIDQVRFRLENARARIDQIKLTHQNEKNVLLNTISDVEDIDTNEAAVKMTTLQTQLQISYEVTARLQDLSLVNFIRPF